MKLLFLCIQLLLFSALLQKLLLLQQQTQVCLPPAPSFPVPLSPQYGSLFGRRPFHCSRTRSTYRCLEGFWVGSGCSGPNHWDTWHFAALSGLLLFLSGLSLHSLQQTAAILLQLPVRPSLRSLNQTVRPRVSVFVGISILTETLQFSYMPVLASIVYFFFLQVMCCKHYHQSLKLLD